MSAPIQSVSSVPMLELDKPAAGAKGTGFQQELLGAIADVEAFHKSATDSVQQFLSGEGGELHTAALATQRAELSFDLFLQTRNKVLSAYQEIMRMPM